jgi:hypothetical protein
VEWPDPEQAQKTSRTLLADFLVAELQIAQTMLDVARTERQHPSDSAAAARLIQNAQTALATVRKFLPRLKDSALTDKAHQIEQEADQIQVLVDEGLL